MSKTLLAFVCLIAGILLGFAWLHLTDPDHWRELEHIVEAKKAHAAESHYRLVTGTPDHDWSEDKGHKATPPCGDPLPCRKDLIGGPGPEKLYGLGGMDHINAKGGKDILYGGDDMDALYGHEGNDRLYGQEGHDHMWGNSGDDLLVTADGEDEPMHIETTDGDTQMKNDGKDACIMDEDTDGVASVDCETLILRDVPSVEGDTPLFLNHRAFVRGDVPVRLLAGPGTYH